MENQENKKYNLPLALVLSALIAVAGAVVWGLLYTFGWFVSIIAYVTAMGMFAVYLKFYPKKTKLVFIWTLAWIIILNSISILVSAGIYVSIELGMPLGQVFAYIFQNFGSIAGDFAIDAFLGAVFAVLGVVSYNQFYKNKQKQEEQAMANSVANAPEAEQAPVEIVVDENEQKQEQTENNSNENKN